MQIERHNRLWTIAAMLLALWLAGLATSYTMGGFIHVLPAIAAIIVLFNLTSRRRGA